ncbi:MAG: MBL fold metallo-hydrolase [Gemmatimonadetes bacterium]|nr:MBL fold metallo-hydrolase [Gemmatimonadota bacterium]
MAARTPTIVNVGYRSTNFWVVSAGTSRLLVDLGWPGMVQPLLANLARMDVPLKEIRYGLATHYHIDHAGAAQDLKQRGMKLLVTPEQVAAIPAMKQWTKPTDGYAEIATHDNVVVPLAESRAFLETLDIGGEILHTPGHSDDHVTLLLDNGVAFTGDLNPMMPDEASQALVEQSWALLLDRGMTTIYPGHGPVRPVTRGVP